MVSTPTPTRATQWKDRGSRFNSIKSIRRRPKKKKRKENRYRDAAAAHKRPSLYYILSIHRVSLREHSIEAYCAPTRRIIRAFGGMDEKKKSERKEYNTHVYNNILRDNTCLKRACARVHDVRIVVHAYKSARP